MADYLGMGEETSFPNQLLGQQAKLATIANTKATTEHTLASADYIQQLSRDAKLRGDQQELEFDVGKKIGQLNELAQSGSGQPTDGSSPMEMLSRDAQLYFKAGLPTKGLDLLKAAGTMTAQQATAAARTVQAEAAKQKATTATLSRYEGMLGSVDSQEGWDAIKQAILAEDPNTKPFMDKLGDFSPEKAKYYARAVAGYKERMTADNAQRRTDIYEKLKESEMIRRDKETELKGEKVEIERQRATNLKKVGGAAGDKPAGLPTKAEVSEATNQLKALNVPADDATSQEVAQQARILWKKNPGLTPAMASAQVIQKMITAGDIKPGTVEKGFFSDKNVPGSVFSATKPVPLPTDPTKFVKGQYYQTPKGVVKYVDGVHDQLVSGGE